MEIKEGFQNTEIGMIPCEWALSNITVLTEQTNGIKIGPFGSQLKKELLVNVGYKVYGQENIYEKNMELGKRYISVNHFKKLISCELIEDDFIISMMGTIGKCMIVPKLAEPGIMDSHLIRLRLDKKKIQSELLLHFFTSQILLNQVKRLSVGGIMDGLSSKIIKNIIVPLPPSKAEQTAIATALNDANALISALEKLIAKKRAIKQGAMQELLKPKEGWEEKEFGSITDKIIGGGTPSRSNPIFWGNEIPWVTVKDFATFNSLCTQEYITKDGLKSSASHLIPKGTIITSTRMALGKAVIYDVDVCINQDLKAIFPKKEIVTKYLFYWFQYNSKLIEDLGNGSTVMGLTLVDLRQIKIFLPSFSTQARIAQILSDMDAEIEVLEKKLEKCKRIKQGMMQELLTGRIRLINSTTGSAKEPLNLVRSTKKEKNNKHSWAINEAVVISSLVFKFSSLQYPLGRKRYTKLSYLMHRYAESVAEGYLKKAAGPYNPKTKYGGPEKIACKNKYIKEAKSCGFVGFVVDENINQAIDYFNQWYGEEILDWLEQFRKVKNDTLELWATTDMAMQDLKLEGVPISVRNLKQVFENNPEWKAKLEREIFSDLNIDSAIRKCNSLFE